jgi:hypothetical protein
MLRFSAILVLVFIGTDHVWSEPALETALVTLDTMHIRGVEECSPVRNKVTRDAQEFQSFEHPEETIIEDLGALSQPRQPCSLRKRRLLHSR